MAAGANAGAGATSARNLISANRDVVERSVRLGVDVQEGPRKEDLTLVCALFRDPDTVPAGDGMFLEVDHATGKIGGCTIYGYREGLFAERPALRDLLARYRRASEGERGAHSLRLFHALLCLASPGLAEIITADYIASDLLPVATPHGRQDAQGRFPARRAQVATLASLGEGARVVLRRRLATFMERMSAEGRREAAWMRAQLVPPVKWGKPGLAGGGDDTERDSWRAEGETLVPAISVVQIEWSNRGQLYLARVHVNWDLPEIDAQKPLTLILFSPEAAPEGPPWEGWVAGQVSQESIPAQYAFYDFPITRAGQRLPLSERQIVRKWAKTLRVDAVQEDG